MWLKKYLLIVLLAGQAFGQPSSTTPSTITTGTTAAQTSTNTTTEQTEVFYFLDVTVDVTGPRRNETEITAWLDQIFRSKLGECLFSNTGPTTAASTSPQTLNVTEQSTTPQIHNSTTTAFYNVTQNFNSTTNATTDLNGNMTTAATTLNSNDTTTAATTLNGNNTTTAATTLNGNNTTTAATTLNGNNTTTAATTLNGNNTTTAATTLNGNNTTTAATTLNGNNTTTAATTLNGNNTTTAATTLNSNETTTAATALNGNNTTTSGMLNGNDTTAATTLNGNDTTTAATVLNGNNTTTALNGNNTTTAATMLNGNNTTTVATVLNGNNTSTATTMLNGNNTTTATSALNGNNTTTATSALNGNNTTTATSALNGNNTTTVATVLNGNNTTTATSVLNGNNATTATTMLNGNNTTTATSALNGNNTTTVATVLNANKTTTATTLNGNNTTTATSALNSNNTTTAAPTMLNDNTTKITASQSNSPTTATSSTSKSNNPTTSVTSTTLTSNSPMTTQTTKGRNTNGKNSRRKRFAREINSNLPQSSNDSSLLFQGMEISCTSDSKTNQTKCTVLLKLSNKIPSCCILQTLCAASKNSSDIHMVGHRVDERIHIGCNESSGEPNSCIYSGPLGASCEESGPKYVITTGNSTVCGTGECNCSSHCNRSDAYFTLSISLQNSTMKSSFVTSLISKLGQTPNCSIDINGTCQLLATIASEYRSTSANCERTATKEICRVILGFAQEVPICSVADAVWDVFLPEEKIHYDGRVRRAAICGSEEISASSLDYQFTYVDRDLKRANFCSKAEGSNLLKCKTGENLLVNLKEDCVSSFIPTTTAPNVTINSNMTDLNATTSPNVTISQNVTTLNTTASPNVTISQNVTTLNTTASPNVTISQNVTTLNTTTNPNMTNSFNVTTVNPSNHTSSPGNNTTTSGKPTSNTTDVPVSVTTTGISATNGDAESQAKELLALTEDVSKLTAEQIEQLVSKLEKLLSGPTVSKELGDTSVNIVSNLLDASEEKLSSSSDRIIGIVDTVGLKLVIEESTESLLYPSLAVSVKPTDGTNFQETIFSITDPTNVLVRGNPRLKRSMAKDSSIPQGSITLPPSLTQNLTIEEQQLISRVQFNFYQKSSVFQDGSLGEKRLNSGILGASVANLSIKGLEDNVVIRLRNIEPVPANFVAVCVFWDFAFNDGLGGWNSDGCFVQKSTDNETVCGCSHLTSFAILLDLSRETLTSRLQATILTFITYIGCGLSAIFLSITLLTYLSFGKLRKDIPSKILIQLCLALLLLNLVFLVDAWLALYPEAVGLCISTAWFLHYFLLVSFTWMGLEGVHMYYALVKVFNDNISHYMLKFSLVGWGVPMIVVIIVIAIDKNNYGLVSYGKFSDGTSDDFCWIRNDIAFYVAVVAYFCVIFLFNFIMFIVVLVQLHRIKKQNPHNNKHRSTLQDVRSVLGITILLGLTWGFAFFAWGPVNLAFMYLFAIFNSLQGFFIFVFHCLVKETVRRQWRTYLCCGKMRLSENSEWSRTATQKNTKKSPLTSFTSSQSSRPSSTSFLPRTPSLQMNGIGNPLEDRIITADEEPRTDVVLNEINSQLRNRRGS